jgi:hypothetical protein
MRQRTDRDPLAFRRSTAVLATPVEASVLRPGFLRQARAGVTGLCALAVQRAPRGPALMPAGRNPEAARERGYEPRARAPLPLRQSAVTGDVPKPSEIAVT